MGRNQLDKPAPVTLKKITKERGALAFTAVGETDKILAGVRQQLPAFRVDAVGAKRDETIQPSRDDRASAID